MRQNQDAWIFPGLPKDQETLAAIGKIALRHGQLDYALKMAVMTLAGVTQGEAADATAMQGSRDLRRRVRQLARKRFGDGEALVRLDAILEQARQATDNRNALLHALWAHELDGRPVLRKHGDEFGPIPTVAELAGVADDLNKIANDLHMARLDGFISEAIRAPM
jgi:hypothetical protein